MINVIGRERDFYGKPNIKPFLFLYIGTFGTFWGLLVLLDIDYNVVFVLLAITLGIMAFLGYFLLKFKHDKSLSWLAAAAVTAILFFASLGFFSGQIVRHSENGWVQQVTLVTGQLHNVKLVMFTSHHAVFFTGQMIIIVPSADVKRIGSNLQR